MVVSKSLFLDSLSGINLYMVIIILVIIVRCRRSSEWCLIPHWRKKVDGPRMRPAGPAIIASPTAPFPLYSSLYLWCNFSFFVWFYIWESKPGNLFPPPTHTLFHCISGFLFYLYSDRLWSFVSLAPVPYLYLFLPIDQQMPATLYSWYVMDQNISQNWKQRHQTRLNPNL